jgi:glucose/galactose transporter
MREQMENRATLIAMGILAILFFIFGFVTWLNGSLIPFLKILCDLTTFQALFVTFAFYIAYTVMAMPMSYLLERIGYRNSMALGLFIMACGSMLFIPAALSQEYLLFLLALFTLASGLTLLQNASNPYVVLLGDIESAAARISFMGLVNKGAGVIAPLVFSALVFSDLAPLETLNSEEALDALAAQLITPYIIMASMLFGLIFLIKFTPLPHIELDEEDTLDRSSVFAFPQVVLGALALFFYVGIEVIAGDTIGLYGQSLGVGNASSLTSFTMVFMVLGYLIGLFFIPRYLSQQKALLFSSLFGMLFIFGIVNSSETSTAISYFLWGKSSLPLLPDSLFYVALLGLSNALVWPSIWPLALEGLGKYTAKASALLIMAIAGGAVLPLVFGRLSESFGTIQDAYSLGFVCYFFIMMYALFWHKKVTW